MRQETHHLATLLPESWHKVLPEETDKPYFLELQKFLEEEWSSGQIFPPANDIFSALQLTPSWNVRVVILGQDPYHDIGQANGLAFSVPEGVRIPPSLRNILKELQSDLGFTAPSHGGLETWAKQGVLLLNTVLTVQAHLANSHSKKGWETFTDAVIQHLGTRKQHTVFILWGKPAQTKRGLIDGETHTIIASPHPSPLSAHRGFFGSQPFSQANKALALAGQSPINWELPSGPHTPSLF